MPIKERHELLMPLFEEIALPINLDYVDNLLINNLFTYKVSIQGRESYTARFPSAFFVLNDIANEPTVKVALSIDNVWADEDNTHNIETYYWCLLFYLHKVADKFAPTSYRVNRPNVRQ